MEKFKKLLLNKDLGKVLDIGTRRGEFLFRLKEYSRSYDELIGIDTNEKEIELLKEKEEDNIHFLKMDGYSLEYPDEYFDTVALSNTLHHLNDINVMLKEMLRVLKKGGYLVINEMFHDNQSLSRQTHGLMHILEGEIDTELGRIHNKTLTKKEIVNIVENLGMKSFEMTEYFETSEFDKKAQKKYEKLDKMLLSVKDSPKYNNFEEKAKNIKKNYKQHGIKRCEQLLIVGVK